MDVLWFGLAGLIAWGIRLGLWAAIDTAEIFLPYFAVSLVTAIPVFRALRLRGNSHRFFAPHDFVQILLAVTLAILLTVSISFGLFRLEGIQRSLPILHWTIAVLGFSMLRLLAFLAAHGALWREDRHAHSQARVPLLIIGYTPLAEIFLRMLLSNQGGHFFVAGIVDEDAKHQGLHLRHSKVIGRTDELPQILAQLTIHGMPVQKLVLTRKRKTMGARAQSVISRLEKTGQIEILDFHAQTTAFFNVLGTSTTLEPMPVAEGLPVPREIRARAESAVASYSRGKRLFDLAAACTLALLMLPIMAIAIPAIWASMGAPFYFWQERPGHGGKVFRLYKLRTFAHGVGPNGEILDDKERETGVGRFLRRARLDEIPQLWNVLRGEMSFVGPRPLLPADLPEDMADWVRLRAMVRPGITGWAQINGGQAVSKDDKLVLDAWYVTHMSLWTDLRIIWGTFKVVMAGEMLDPANIRSTYENLGIAQPVPGDLVK